MATSGTTVTDEYLAGLFDGEGAVSMSLAKKGYVTVAVTVSMCDRAPIAALHARFGGGFQDGLLQTSHGRSIYRWSVFNAGAVEALEVFGRLCLVKCVVAQAALGTAYSMRDNKTRGALSHDVKAARVAAAEVIARINKPVGPRRILNQEAVAAYMAQKRTGGSTHKVRLSDGREFYDNKAAATALGVTHSAVSHAKRTGRPCKGFLVEYF
jgi:hypothetical protein